MLPFARTALTLLLMSACGPQDVIPSAPNHPANPNAPLGASPPATAPDAGMVASKPDAGPPEGHDGHDGHDPQPDPKDPAVIAAAEKAAIDKAMPTFRKHCAGCHTSGGAKMTKQKMDHFNMDSYPFGGHHAAEMGKTIRKVLGLAGEKATMPANNPGAVQGEELEIIRAWTEAFDRAHAAGLHKHDGHGHHGAH